jgi:hypothetical protein
LEHGGEEALGHERNTYRLSLAGDESGNSSSGRGGSPPERARKRIAAAASLAFGEERRCSPHCLKVFRRSHHQELGHAGPVSRGQLLDCRFQGSGSRNENVVTFVVTPVPSATPLTG